METEYLFSGLIIGIIITVVVSVLIFGSMFKESYELNAEENALTFCENVNFELEGFDHEQGKLTKVICSNPDTDDVKIFKPKYRRR